jgi:3' exoribonuclease, RNase T-like
MKLFLDTEFTGLQQSTTLISIGITSEDGKEFYAQLTDYDSTQINDWIRSHVLSKLETYLPDIPAVDAKSNYIKAQGTHSQVATALLTWFSQFESVEIWADVLAYDWVLFCELFGGALHIPNNIFYAPFDLATVFRLKGHILPTSKYDQDISRFDFVGADKSLQHHALHDARVEMLCYQKLMKP